MIRNVLRSRVLSRAGLRDFCDISPPGSNAVTKRFKVIYDKVSEDDIEAMFDYSVDRDIISDNWDDAMEVIKKSEEVFTPYKPTETDLLRIIGTRPTMTLGSLVNESKTLQNLVDLGVELHWWDKMGHLGLAAKLEFVRDVAPVIRFLADIGVEHDKIGRILTFSPGILEEKEADLKTRVAYLASKQFSQYEISNIITSSPSWLCFNVRSIDARLGFFQKSFDFLGSEVRHLTNSLPTLITWVGTPNQVKKNIFSYNEEMGFSKEEIKSMTLNCPKILKQKNENKVIAQFELLHNEAKIPHEILAKFPQSLIRPYWVARPRFKFLESIGRAQFDPTQPNYVSPDMLTCDHDEDFCENVAKCSIELFDKFQKTL